MARVLRPYQVDALAGIRSALEAHASCVCVLPTGTGKTSVASALMNDWPSGNCLFLAHTRELVDQAWSVTQPAFQERLAALQRKISGRP